MIYAILGFCFGYFFGYGSGWNTAHKHIASECQKLGGFFVGKQTFKCTEIKNDV